MAKLLSGKVKRRSADNLDSNRNTFLDIENAEPALGNPTNNNSVLLSDANGDRQFLKLDSGFVIDQIQKRLSVSLAQFSVFDLEDFDDSGIEVSRVPVWDGTKFAISELGVSFDSGDATLFGGQPPSFYRNVSNVLSGTLANQFLPDSISKDLSGQYLGFDSDFDIALAAKTTDNLTEGSTNLYHTDSRSRASISVGTNSVTFDAGLTYDSVTGQLSFDGPDSADIVAVFSGGTGVSISDSGIVSIGQAVGTTDDVTFNDVTINDTLIINGATTSIASSVLNIGARLPRLNYTHAGTPTQNVGFVVERGAESDRSFIWNETGDYWDLTDQDLRTTGKLYFANTFDSAGVFPSASIYSGMFAYASSQNVAYYSNGTAWIKLLDPTELSVDSNNVTFKSGLTYDSLNSSFSFSGPDSADIRTVFSGGTGVTIDDSGEISIGQSVGTADNVQFNNMTVDGDIELNTSGSRIYVNGTLETSDSVNVGGNLRVAGDLTVQGTTTTVNTETVNLADNIISLNSNFTSGTPTENAGIEVIRGDSATKSFVWDETSNRWTIGTENFAAGSIVLTGTIDGDLVNFRVRFESDALDFVDSSYINARIDPGQANNADALGGIAASRYLRSDSNDFVTNNGTITFTDGSQLIFGTDSDIKLSYNTDSDLLLVEGTVRATAFKGDGSGLTNVGGVSGVSYNDTNAILTVSTPSGDFTDTISLDPFTTAQLTENASYLYFTNARARGAISVGTNTTTFGAGLSYNNVNGQFTFVGPNSDGIRTVFSGGTGVDINGTGVISIGQDVGTTDTVTFQKLTATDSISATTLDVSTIDASGNVSVGGGIDVTGTVTAVDVTISGDLSTEGEIINTPTRFVVTTSTLITVDEYAHSNTATSLEYLIHAQDSGNNETLITKILTTYDGTTSAFTEFGELHTGDSNFGDFIVDDDGTNIRLRFLRRSGRGTINIKPARTIIK